MGRGDAPAQVLETCAFSSLERFGFLLSKSMSDPNSLKIELYAVTTSCSKHTVRANGISGCVNVWICCAVSMNMVYTCTNHAIIVWGAGMEMSEAIAKSTN